MHKKPWYDLKELKYLNSDLSHRIGSNPPFHGSFSERNRFNIPGPFYGAETDSCLTGPAEAPQNIMVDEKGQEFVYRQPASLAELECVLRATEVDPFEGYGANGDQHWTLPLVRDWWNTRHDLLAEMDSLRKWNDNVDEWHRYLHGPAIDYLRQYVFFIEEGKLPQVWDSLPML
ncbi:hypothetical protein [Gimesia sp.]|uniref:hypothetical protein n=1 Tax=Gimesia sp. TaxID=2024833 RepID=UPI000C5D6FE3|nr:hypothetical protein [Gimesia sp.]MAX40716.1 sugar ABC transporter ATP-binding protein [Gimesia sp.]HAH44980.1 ferredoxin [Planctomycetaceae bacterium]HBL46193.1 ferredoxin [Planctomycetaceae bacterium]|tara:strand:+ start:4878 stop:5399 length:522 start_codon:yes stop_codon:yes gene_type:complete